MMQEKQNKSTVERFFPVMVVLLVVMAFGLGSMWSKVKYLESGGSGGAGGSNAPAAGNQAAPVTGKYKTLEEALQAMGREAGLDTNQLVKCVDSGEKAEVVNADYEEGMDVGVQGTPGFFVNGKFLGGAFPFSAFKEVIDRELAGTGSDDYNDYEDSNLKGAGATNPPAFVAKPVDVNIGSAAFRGPSGAKVIVVEYSDFQCPYCSRGYETVSQILNEYPDDVRFVFKNFPLNQIHPLAQKMSEAWECARDQDQNKAWKLHDLIFENQTDWTNAAL